MTVAAIYFYSVNQDELLDRVFSRSWHENKKKRCISFLFPPSDNKTISIWSHVHFYHTNKKVCASVIYTLQSKMF